VTVRAVRVVGSRSIADSGELRLGPVTVVTGPNNSGKSALLRAIYLMQEGAPFRPEDNRLRAGGPATVTAWFDEPLPAHIAAAFAVDRPPDERFIAVGGAPQDCGLHYSGDSGDAVMRVGSRQAGPDRSVRTTRRCGPCREPPHCPPRRPGLLLLPGGCSDARSLGPNRLPGVRPRPRQTTRRAAANGEAWVFFVRASPSPSEGARLSALRDAPTP
jgi:AAA domain, putative AbiEii toxin, Type IV TA system